jgi:hypothetical protein
MFPCSSVIWDLKKKSDLKTWSDRIWDLNPEYWDVERPYLRSQSRIWGRGATHIWKLNPEYLRPGATAFEILIQILRSGSTVFEISIQILRPGAAALFGLEGAVCFVGL